MNTQEATEVFDGVMLSDGSITPIARTAVFNIDLSGIEHIDWLQVVKEALLSINTQACANHPRLFKGTSKGLIFYGCILTSRTSQFIVKQRIRWYPDGKKIVPPDLVITPIVLAHWFIGDGSSVCIGMSDDIRIRFATHSYSQADTLVLVEKLKGIGLSSSKAARDADYYIIEIHDRNDTLLFMNMIKQYIPGSYAYKIKGI